MPYYDTIEEDLARAKAILDKVNATRRRVEGGAISVEDVSAAYQLLERFVAEIERLREERDAAINISNMAVTARRELEREVSAAEEGGESITDDPDDALRRWEQWWKLDAVMDTFTADDFARVTTKFFAGLLALQKGFATRYPDEWRRWEREYYGDNDDEEGR